MIQFYNFDSKFYRKHTNKRILLAESCEFKNYKLKFLNIECSSVNPSSDQII